MPNRLANATSPYLRQHAANPVEWEEWGESAFQRARAEKKPILLSVGYAACHWCHVMAHESFENEAIAKQINEGFVPIKVDREERPDIDQIYQQAIQLLGVGGGWPLTAFLTTDGRPFYGGTYFPPQDAHGRPGFPKVLAAIREAWEQRPEEVEGNANELTGALKDLEALPEETGEVLGDVFQLAARWLLQRVDPENGGLGRAPKFPNTMAIEVLLRWAHGTRTESGRDASLFTLGKMAEGGIYDQIGAGFHRYSVDERWHVPHFEKMLYDNALLAKSYVQAWQTSGLGWCKQIALETLSYLAREMRTPDGAYYASTDADSAPPADPKGHPEEGLFFVWTLDEIEKLVGADDAKAFAIRYGVTKEGNWEHGKNVLHLSASDEDVAKETGRPIEEIRQAITKARVTLYEARAKRPPPFRDEKVLVSWNALAISAFALAGAAFGEANLVEVATQAADSILSWAMPAPGRLLRAKPALAGTLDDYANLSEALLDLWEATLDPRWLERATELATAARERFAGEEGEVYLTAKDGESLVHRPMSLHDQSLPAGVSVITRVWLRLGRLMGRDDLDGAAKKVLHRHRHAMYEQPFAFGSMLVALDDDAHPVDVVLAGPTGTPEAQALLRVIRSRFVPGLCTHVAPLLAGQPARSPLAADKTPKDGKPTVYVCRDRTCSPPVTDPAELEKLL